MKRVVLFSSLLLFAVSAAPPVHALAGVCANREAAKKLLTTRYKEQQVATGVTRNGGLLELYSSKSGTSWSVLLTQPNGMSCILALGTDLVAEAIPLEEAVLLPEM